MRFLLLIPAAMAVPLSSVSAEVIYRQTFSHNSSTAASPGTFGLEAYRTPNSGAIENITTGTSASAITNAASKFFYTPLNATRSNPLYTGDNGRLFASKSNPSSGAWALFTNTSETAAINSVAGFTGDIDDLFSLSIDHGNQTGDISLRFLVKVNDAFYVSNTSFVNSIGGSGNYANADPGGAQIATLVLSGGAEWRPVSLVPGSTMGSIDFGASLVNLTGAVQAYGVHGTWSASDASTMRFDNFTITAVPEPAMVGLLGLGAGALLRRRRS